MNTMHEQAMNVRPGGASARTSLAVRGFLVLVASAMLFVSTATSQVVQMASGRVVLAEVVDADSEGLTLRRLDDGGVLELTWTDLSKLHAENIRRRFGIDTGDESEVTVAASAVRFRAAGGSVDEVIGIIVERTDTALRVQRKGAITDVPRARFESDETIQVRWDEIYTEDEWYALELASFAPGEDADANVRLAENLRRAGLYEQAKTHYEKAEELGGGAFSAQLSTYLARIDTLIESKEERDLLADIRRQRFRKRFSQAFELVAQFEEQFPTSDLRAEFEKEKLRLEEAQTIELGGDVRSLFSTTLSEVAYAVAGDDEITLERARDYASEQMATDVFTRISERLMRRNKGVELDADAVAELWSRRSEFGRRPFSKFFGYDFGSWVLGEDAVIAGTDRAGGGATNDEEADPELERFVRQLREIERRGRRASARSTEDEDESPEDWWKSSDRNERQSWLQAYFAEFSGQLEIRRAVAVPCPTCAARGFITSVSSSGDGGLQQLPCPTCHGTKFLRAIRVR
ncbi:MAG: hypothetical protein AAF196_05015 [Planctomycetota bacterium]